MRRSQWERFLEEFYKHAPPGAEPPPEPETFDPEPAKEPIEIPTLRPIGRKKKVVGKKIPGSTTNWVHGMEKAIGIPAIKDRRSNARSKRPILTSLFFSTHTLILH